MHQNRLAVVVDIYGWSTGRSTFWQPHMSVNATEGTTGKWPLKQCVCPCAYVSVCAPFTRITKVKNTRRFLLKNIFGKSQSTATARQNW